MEGFASDKFEGPKLRTLELVRVKWVEIFIYFLCEGPEG